MPEVVDVLLWLAAVELVGLAALPLAHRLLDGFPDRGYSAAKMLGLVVIAYAAWVTSILGVTSFTGPTIVVLAAALGVAGWWRWGARVRADWSQVRPWAIAGEATFLLVFLVGVWVRAYSGAIAGTEKPMDFTFLHSLIRAQVLPAEDLWLAGYAMPYYYFGYLTQSLVAKATAISPPVAYNLAVTTVLALGAISAFGLAGGLTRLLGAPRWLAIGAGAVGAFALNVMGNLEAAFEWLAGVGFGDQAFWSAMAIKNLQAHGQGFPPPDGGWWFKPARVIPNIQPDGIAEFPYFSFLLGDLHPHYMAIPLGLLIAALASQQLLGAVSTAARAELVEADRPSTGSGRADGVPRDWLALGVSAVALGAVIPYNTWDVPVLWGLFGLGFLLGPIRAAGYSPELLLNRGRDLALLAVASGLLYAPYFVGYVSQPLGLGVTAERTPFGSLFVLFGPLLVLAFGAGTLGAYQSTRGSAQTDPAELHIRLNPLLPAGGLAVGALLAVVREPTLGFLVASLALWLSLLWARVVGRRSAAAVAVALLTTAGLGSILLPELVFLRDAFQSRMNTVFKFYYDAWILLAVAAPVLAWELLQLARPPRAAAPGRGTDERRASRARVAPMGAAQPAWARLGAGGALAAAAALTVAGAVYPTFGTYTKSERFARPPTLDGMAQLRTLRADDAAAIEWLQRNGGGARVVEALGHDYTDAARISTFAGVPTLVGWIGHENQWRGASERIAERERLARQVYTADPSAWRDAVARLGVRFVVFGSMEREIYGPQPPPFADVWPLVHRAGDTAIYAVPPAAADEASS